MIQPLDGLPGRVSDLFGQAVDAVLARNGLRARHWHVLQALENGSRTRAQIAEALLPFWVAASVTQTDVVDDLVRRDWVSTDGERYELTEAGSGAVERIRSALDDVSAQALDGVSVDSEATARAVLDIIRENLERVVPKRGGTHQRPFG